MTSGPTELPPADAPQPPDSEHDPESAFAPASTPPPVLQGAGGDGASLSPDAEVTIWSGRTNWRHFGGSLLLGGLLLIVIWALLVAVADKWSLKGSTEVWIGLIATAVVAGFLGTRILLRVLQYRYRITTQRLFIEKGILSQTIDQTELIRVDDVRVRKKLVDRFFGLGTIEILSTDATDKSVIIEGVRDPDKIAEHIRSCMRTLRSRSLFVEGL